MTPFDCYKTYLALKNHFTKPNYDYFKYCGRSRASVQSFHKRKDRYFFEKMSRQKSDDEIKAYFVANFIQCTDPSKLWIGEIIASGEENYTNWQKRIQSLTYMFKTESEVFLSGNIDSMFECKKNQHPDILKKHLQNAITIETMVILDIILGYTKRFDKKMESDPVWETGSTKIKKYKPFLNINENKCKQILKEIVL